MLKHAQEGVNVPQTLRDTLEMAMNAVMHQAESDEAPSLGYFFVTAGAVKFSEAQSFAPGSAQTIVIAQKYGVAIFSDGEGIEAHSAQQSFHQSNPVAFRMRWPQSCCHAYS